MTPQSPPQAAFLGVSCSLTNRRWIGPAGAVERRAEELSQRSGVFPALAMVLAQRGVVPEEVEGYLNPLLRDLLPDPHRLMDMERAAARFWLALERGERIAIFADYDVDGGASAALLIWWLRAHGMSATLYVPDRIDEGYGPNPNAMRRLAGNHALIVCVDCGTASHEALAAVQGEVDVLVLDHHLGTQTLPPALAVVNPNRADESGELGHLCAAGVVFLMLVELNRQGRGKGRPGPDLMGLLDLVALATVADVAPLVGVNRALVRQGLRVMAQRQRPGLVALADVARLDRAPESYHLGFVFGPRVNAGGRVGAADLGARLLACNSPEEAHGLAMRLEDLNRERRDIEARVRAQAMEQAEARGLDRALVWAAGEGWHPGVVGIVASRLKEATNRPAVVIGLDGEGNGKGSGRSISGVDLGAEVQKLAARGLISSGGGHKMAAGLSLSGDQLEAAMEALEAGLARQGAAKAGAGDLRLDGLLMPGALQPDLIRALEDAGPFGASSPAPSFAIPEARLHFAKRVGETHLKLTFSDGTGPRCDAIAFGAFETALGEALQNHAGRPVHLAGRLELNHWQGRERPQLRLTDAAFPQ